MRTSTPVRTAAAFLLLGLFTGCNEAPNLGQIANLRSQVQDTDPLITYRLELKTQPTHHRASVRFEGNPHLVQPVTYPRH